jgi:hypothetical protein
MGAVILNLLRNHMLASGMVMLSAIVVVVFMLQRNAMIHLKQDIQLCHAEGKALAISNASLLASLHEQNKAISAMSREAMQRKAASQKALQTAKAQSMTYASRAQELRNQSLSGDDCAQIKTLLRNF